MSALIFLTDKMQETYQQQLHDKIVRIRAQFSDFLVDEVVLSVFESPPKHFRQRAEFRLWHERDNTGKNTGEAFYAMFEPGQRASQQTLRRVDRLPIAGERINALMPVLLDALKAQPVLITRLFQVEFLSTLRGDTLVTLIYHKRLDDEWRQVAEKLAKCLDIHLIGRSRKQKVVLSQDFVTETLKVHKQTFRYRQIEGGFTQPNAEVCEKMLAWACTVAETIQTIQATTSDNHLDLLELYCGNGNFTLPLSRYFRKVLATEVAKTSVAAARHNIADNGCDNIAVARLSAEEFTQAFTRQRQFKRLQHDNIEISDYQVSTIFVDPPRAGVDSETQQLMQQFEHILYISCNPDTLFDNLQKLTQTHSVARMALFDQFPYTHHVEMGVWLCRR